MRLAVLATVALLLARPAVAQGPRQLVIPFENTTRDSRIFWLGEAVSLLLTDELNALGVSVITRDERREAFERLQVPPAIALTDATMIRIGQLVGASQIVVGTIQLENDTLVVKGRSIALDAGRVQSSATEAGPISDLFSITERLARRLGPVAPRFAPAATLERPPLLAFENYVKGLLASNPTTASTYLNAALAIQPGFDRVKLALWDAYTQQDAHDRAFASVQTVPVTSSWYRQARFRAALSQVSLKKYDDAFVIFKALADSRPTPNVLNNLGVIQMRRTPTAQTGQPTYYFNRAAEADKTDPDYFFNLGYAYWIARDTQAAIYWLREAVRRDPTDGDAHFVLGTALSAGGTAAEANREKELARRLSSTYAEWEKRPGPDVVPKGLERLKGDVELPHSGRVEETLASSGQRDQRELAQFYYERGRRAYEQENDRDALAELNRALFLSPYMADAHLLIGRIHLRSLRFRDAVDALKIALWSSETAEAHAVLAEAYLGLKDDASARTEAQKALALDPSLEAARRTLDKARAKTPTP